MHHTQVTWERHLNKTPRCQRWGRATANCHMAPRCMKCAGEHKTNLCLKDINTPAKCANCGDDHITSSTTCRTYERKLAQNQEQRQTIRRDVQSNWYIRVPEPVINAWTGQRTRTTQQREPGYFRSADQRWTWPLLPKTQETWPVGESSDVYWQRQERETAWLLQRRADYGPRRPI